MIKARGLKKTFQGKNIPILNGIDLDISQGDFCIMIGGNGSGKSTLLRCLAGYECIDEGLVNTTPSSAFVTQDIKEGTIGELSLLENMVLSKSKKRMGLKQGFKLISSYHKEIYQEIASVGIGLEKYIHTPMSHLSGGQRQTIATIMALRSNPSLLFLDEHTSALDPSMHQTLMEITASSIKKQNITTLMITHSFEDAVAFGNRLIMLDQGKVVLNLDEQEKQKLTAPQLYSLFLEKQSRVLRSNKVAAI